MLGVEAQELKRGLTLAGRCSGMKGIGGRTIVNAIEYGGVKDLWICGRLRMKLAK